MPLVHRQSRSTPSPDRPWPDNQSASLLNSEHEIPLRYSVTTLAWAQTATQEAASLLARFENVQGIANRMSAFSATFIGLPYGDGGPLGEGVVGRYDQDPLFRFDTFDCTTYVETMLALAHAHSVADFAQHMDDIRYENGVVDYVTRNHWPSLQWVPNNIRNGYLRDITRELYAPLNVKVARAIIDVPNSYRFMRVEDLRVPGLTPAERLQRTEEWRAEGQRFSAQEATIDYVPIDWIMQNPSWVQKIPHGSVINFVRPNWDLTQSIGTHMNVSHQGLVFRRGQQVLLRHASSSGSKLVTEVPLLDYLRPFVGHATMKGVHFLAVE